MTPTQRRCLDTIKAMTVNGVPPTLDELGATLGLPNKSGVHRLLSALERQKLISREHGKSRSIIVLADQGVYTPAALSALSTDDLKHLTARVGGLMAHRLGGQEADRILCRIGARLAGRPRVPA